MKTEIIQDANSGLKYELKTEVKDGVMKQSLQPLFRLVRRGNVVAVFPIQPNVH
jgi:hypothetical protein